MKRDVHFAVKLTQEEHAIFNAVAQQEKMPVGTLIRRLMLLEADKHGIVVNADGGAEVEK